VEPVVAVGTVVVVVTWIVGGVKLTGVSLTVVVALAVSAEAVTALVKDSATAGVITVLSCTMVVVLAAVTEPVPRTAIVEALTAAVAIAVAVAAGMVIFELVVEIVVAAAVTAVTIVLLSVDGAERVAEVTVLPANVVAIDCMA
jgi:hypothetical protein